MIHNKCASFWLSTLLALYSEETERRADGGPVGVAVRALLCSGAWWRRRRWWWRRVMNNWRGGWPVAAIDPARVTRAYYPRQGRRAGCGTARRCRRRLRCPPRTLFPTLLSYMLSIPIVIFATLWKYAVSVFNFIRLHRVRCCMFCSIKYLIYAIYSHRFM